MSVQCGACIHRGICTRSCEDYCHDMNLQTNYDLIRSKSIEEMAEWHYENSNCPPDRGYPDCGVTPYSNGNNCKKCWLDWLKQEVTE